MPFIALAENSEGISTHTTSELMGLSTDARIALGRAKAQNVAGPFLYTRRGRLLPDRRYVPKFLALPMSFPSTRVSYREA